MEGALPSVVGGLVEAPVIAVPTSVGYGASFQGLAALLAMLNSCASGVAVVNIDNGFGAGYLACAILRVARAPPTARIRHRDLDKTVDSSHLVAVLSWRRLVGDGQPWAGSHPRPSESQRQTLEVDHRHAEREQRPGHAEGLNTNTFRTLEFEADPGACS